MEDEVKRLKDELEKQKLRHKIELAFSEKRVRNVKAAMSIFDTDNLEKTEDGGFVNLNESLDSFKADNPWLFENDAKPLSTGMPHGRNNTKPYDKMSDEEYYHLALNKKEI